MNHKLMLGLVGGLMVAALSVMAAEDKCGDLTLTGKLAKHGAKCVLTTADGMTADLPASACAKCKCAGETVKVVCKGEVKEVKGKKCVDVKSVTSITEVGAKAAPAPAAPAEDGDGPEATGVLSGEGDDQ